MLLDKTSEYGKSLLLAPVAVADDTAQVSSIIDLQNKLSVNFDVMTGVLADANATFAVGLFAGNESNLSDEVEVTSSDELIGTVSDFTFAEDSTVYSFGYKGIKRYARVKITPTGNGGSAPLAVLATYKKKKVGSV
jgi:hypothetical protein